MTADRQQQERTERLLEETLGQVQPVDSWQGLRRRIDARLDRLPGDNRLVFWRRAAVALAACLLVTAGILVYCVVNRPPLGASASAAPLLTEAHVERLTEVFRNVGVLFAEESAWFMIDSTGESEIGTYDELNGSAPADRAVILRVALCPEHDPQNTRYVDVVTRPGGRMSVQVAVSDGVKVRLSLAAQLTAQGAVVLDATARANGARSVAQTTDVATGLYTSLLRVRAGAQWITLRATGTVVSI